MSHLPALAVAIPLLVAAAVSSGTTTGSGISWFTADPLLSP